MLSRGKRLPEAKIPLRAPVFRLKGRFEVLAADHLLLLLKKDLLFLEKDLLFFGKDLLFFGKDLLFFCGESEGVRAEPNLPLLPYKRGSSRNLVAVEALISPVFDIRGSWEAYMNMMPGFVVSEIAGRIAL